MGAVMGAPIIKSIDDSGIVIDEGIWRETNQILEKNPEWKGINIISSSPGQFVLSGYMRTRAQAEKLSDYLSNNFPYPDLLEKRIVVDEDGVDLTYTYALNGSLQLTGRSLVQAPARPLSTTPEPLCISPMMPWGTSLR
jgi:hypothetical protein